MDRDTALLNAAKRMDQDAIVCIFDLYSSSLFNYALRLCGDPVMADQIVGDVFAKLLDRLAAGEGPQSNLRSYLFEITYHQIVDEARYSKRRATLEVADTLRQDAHSAILSLDEEVLFKQVLNVLQHDLTDDQRHVIVLRFLEGFSLRETADIIDKSVGHVKVIQNRAIVALRKSLVLGGKTKPRALPKIREFSKASGIS